MSDLRDIGVLVVEDDYVIAVDLAEALLGLHARVIGPVPTAEEALIAIRDHRHELDAAVLDINLGAHTAYPVADVLRAQGVPFVFTTGYDAGSVPAAYGDVPRCYKPVDPSEVLHYLRASSSVFRAQRM